MRNLNINFDDNDFEQLKSNKEVGENWQRYLLRLLKENKEKNSKVPNNE